MNTKINITEKGETLSCIADVLMAAVGRLWVTTDASFTITPGSS
ncbi:hypothetical protein [Streptomyces cinereoruber]